MTLQGGDSKQGDLRIKRFMTMIDSMTEKELNSSDLKMLSQRSRVERISRGAGRRPEEFLELLGGLSFALSGQHRLGRSWSCCRRIWCRSFLFRLLISPCSY